MDRRREREGAVARPETHLDHQRSGVVELLARLLFAFVCVAGFSSLVGASWVEGESDLVVEETEDGESVEEARLHARAARRSCSGSAPLARELGMPEVPRDLRPTVVVLARPRWSRLRRVPPPDDDPTHG